MADEPNDGSNKNRDAPTVRDLKGPELSGDTLPDVVGLYVPPRPLPEASQHRTLDLQSVRLSSEADPRRALTERKLVSPPTPKRRRVGPWLVASVALLLAVGAWTLFRDPQRAPIDAGSLARPATAVKKVVTPATAVRSVPPPVAVPAKAPESAARVPAGAAAGPEPKTEEPVASPAKSARSRESAKKRKDPWLE